MVSFAWALVSFMIVGISGSISYLLMMRYSSQKAAIKKERAAALDDAENWWEKA